MKDAVWDREPDVPFTVIRYDPAEVDTEDESVKVEVQLGLQDEAENAAVVPDGRPEAERETGIAVPEIRLRLTG
jgi:hypothetical protein